MKSNETFLYTLCGVADKNKHEKDSGIDGLEKLKDDLRQKAEEFTGKYLDA